MTATGTIKLFNAQRGFGFILQDRGGPDVSFTSRQSSEPA